MQRSQPTGALLRLWNATHRSQSAGSTSVTIVPHQRVIERHQRFLEAVPTGTLTPYAHRPYPPEPITDPSIRRHDVAAMETIHMPSIDTEKTAALLAKFPYLEYHRPGESPLTMVYGAVIASVEKWGRLPDALFVSPLLIPLLDVQITKMTGLAFGGCLRLVTENSVSHKPMIRAVQVFPEELLPDVIKAKLWGHISRDSVIAVCEQ